MRVTITLSVLFLAVFAAQSCQNGTTEPPEPSEPSQDVQQAAVVAALDALAAELAAERPEDITAYTTRLQTYLDANPTFFASAVALFDETGTVTGCPYVYRTADGYDTLDLSTPSYNIKGQDWFTMPLEASEGTWTAPYFDEGGGEIWMITRSVPVHNGEEVFAIVTTDLPVDAPEGNDK